MGYEARVVLVANIMLRLRVIANERLFVLLSPIAASRTRFRSEHTAITLRAGRFAIGGPTTRSKSTVLEFQL